MPQTLCLLRPRGCCSWHQAWWDKDTYSLRLQVRSRRRFPGPFVAFVVLESRILASPSVRGECALQVILGPARWRSAELVAPIVDMRRRNPRSVRKRTRCADRAAAPPRRRDAARRETRVARSRRVRSNRHA
eukprot:6182884-Pleurochrysis_carterae.AAC.1